MISVMFKARLLLILSICFLQFAITAPAQDASVIGDFIYKADIRSSGSLGDVVYTTAEGDFPTIKVSPNESLDIAFTLPSELAGKIVQIRADNGGVIKGGKDGAFQVLTEGKNSVLNFTYILGKPVGRYSLKIKAPGFLQILEFWVGKEPPTGQPGPALKFSAPEITADLKKP